MSCNNTYTNCNDTIGCDKFYSSACIKYTGTPYTCNGVTPGITTLNDLLEHTNAQLCTLVTIHDLSDLDRTCYTSAPNTGITVKTVLNELIQNYCSVNTAIAALTTSLNSYIPDYKLDTLDSKCLEMDPCRDNECYTLPCMLQKIINKICIINTQVATLESGNDSLGLQYPIDRTLYSCIGSDITKSDLDNLYSKVNWMCNYYGAESDLLSAFALDDYGISTTIAQNLMNLWGKIATLSSGGGGTIYNFTSDFTTSGSIIGLSSNVMKYGSTAQSYIRSQYTGGNQITIDGNGVIDFVPTSTSPGAVIRDIFFDDLLASYPTSDGQSFVTAVASADMKNTATLTLLFSAGPAATSQIVVNFIDLNLGSTYKSRMLIHGLDYTIIGAGPSRTGISIATGTLPNAAYNVIDITYTT